jgi:hypothetical protein
MGILDDDDLEEIDELIEKENLFHPMDLNNSSVQAIFNRCLKKDNTKEIRYSTLFNKDLGYEKTDIPVHFDKDLIKQNTKIIKYLYGQLSVIHNGLFSVTFDTVQIKYDGTQWTKNNGIIMEFFHLGVAANIMSPFSANSQCAGFIKIEPTLSPKDPNFPTWWEEHKSEWED